MLRLFIFFFTFCCGISATWAWTHIKDFRKETREHRMRVLDYALLSIEKFPQFFPELHKWPQAQRTQIIETYMYLHDLPKMMSKEQLAEFGYTHDRSLLSRLHRIYGVDARPEAIDDLNNIEKIIKAYIMEKKMKSLEAFINNNWDKIMEELYLAERASDVADTKNFRTRELSIKWEPGSAYQFLASRGEKKAAEIADWIQSHEIQDPNLRQCRHLLAVKPFGPEMKISK